MADELDITKIPVEDDESARLLQILGGLLRKLTETLESRLLPFASVLASLAGHLETPTIQAPPGIEAEAEPVTAPQKTERTPLDVTPILRAISQKIEMPQIGSPVPVPRLTAAPEETERRTPAMPHGQELILQPMTKLEEMFRVFTSRLEGLQTKLPPIQLNTPAHVGEQEHGTAMTPAAPAPSPQQQCGPMLAFMFGGLMDGLKNKIQPYVQNIHVGGGSAAGGPPLLAGPGNNDGDCCERLTKLLHEIAVKLDTIIFVNKSIASALPGFVESGGGPPAKKEKEKAGALEWWMNKALPGITNFVQSGIGGGTRPEHGVGAVLGAAGGLVGGTAGTVLKFGEALFESIGRLRNWGESLHQSNIQFADVSASMMAVAKESEARQMVIRHHQGEQLSASARFLAEQKDTFDAVFSNFNNNWNAMWNNIGGVALKAINETAAVLQRGPTAHARDFLPTPGTSLAQFSRDMSGINWERLARVENVRPETVEGGGFDALDPGTRLW